MAESRNIDVFISYAHGDEPWASEFVDELKAQGLRTWFAKDDIALGERVSDKLEEALREAPVVAVLVGPGYLNSPLAAFELGAAVAGDKKIIPIVMEEVKHRPLPLLLRDWQMLEESSPQAAGKRVAAAVENLPLQSAVEASRTF
jgi:hypothetical protein